MNSSWQTNPKYAHWKYEASLECGDTLNTNCYFIRETTEGPKKCALVINGEVLKEFSVIAVDSLSNLKNMPEMDLDGICLEICCFTIGPNETRYAFAFFKKGLPYLFIDGIEYEVQSASFSSTSHGLPAHIWFSSDSKKIYSSLLLWGEKYETEESNQWNEIPFEFQSEDESEDLFPDEYADFYVELNGILNKLLARPSCLVWLENYGSGGSLLLCKSKDGSHYLKACAYPIVGGAQPNSFFFNSILHDSELTVPVRTNFFGFSPDRRYFIFSFRERDKSNTTYILDTSRILTDGKIDVSSWITKVLPDVLPIQVDGLKDRLLIKHIRNEKPEIIVFPYN